jgi:hypothetical protein
MQLQNMKLALVVIYVAIIGAAGVTAGVESISGWAVIATLALLPAVAVLALWKEAPPSLSQSIQAARDEAPRR